jgi:DNA-binding beta-propeller fold protein YncE
MIGVVARRHAEKRVASRLAATRSGAMRGPLAACLCLILVSPESGLALPLQFFAKWGALGSGSAQFDEPSGIAVDGSGRVYVADRNNHRIQVFTDGGAFVTAWGSLGTGDGQFDSPRDVAVDAGGNVYVADFLNDRVQKFTSSGGYITQWGGTGTGDGQFKGPRGIVVDGDGFVYVTEDGLPNKRVQKFTDAGTYVIQWGSFGTGDGQFASPRGIDADDDGYVYVADTVNNRVQKFTSDGVFVAAWGTPGTGAGQFQLPIGVDCWGPSVYVTDSNNHRVQEFTGDGVFLSQSGSFCDLAGGTGCVDPDGGGPLELGDGQFNSPRDLAVDRTGNVFVADGSNHRLQKFGPVPVSGVSEDGSFLEGLLLSPNPTSSLTWLRFALAAPGSSDRAGYQVRARVFDVAGRLVRQLYDGELPHGEHLLAWDGRTQTGELAPPGVFFVRVDVDGAAGRRTKLVRLH